MSGSPSLVAFVRATRERGWPKSEVLAALARVVADAVAPNVETRTAGPLLDGTSDAVDLDGLEPPRELRQPQLLGDALELLNDGPDRRRRGAFFTPHASAALLVERATAGWRWPPRPRVCDPACGGGAFVLAAARELERHGLSRAEIVGELLWAIDVDPLSVAVTRATLSLWCASGGEPAPAAHVVVGDTLRSGLRCWEPMARPFDLVVGNPPFLSQLVSRTARTRGFAAEMSERFGEVSGGYADNAALFLVAASTMTAPGGRLALLLPESFLAARDATAARRAVSGVAALVGLWLPRERLFSASVRVSAPVFEVDCSQPTTIMRWRGADARPAPTTEIETDVLTDGRSWAPLAADLLGVPVVSVRSPATVRSLGSATAGFRDQFYGVAPYVEAASSGGTAGAEGTGVVRLLTSGTIDPVNELWSRRVTIFAGRRLLAPTIDLDRLRSEQPELARWAARVLVPKLVVATQTRVVELMVDETGDVWPSVPTVAVIAPPDQLWRLAAAIASPAASAILLTRHAGAALASDAIKMSASQVLDVPLPSSEPAWGEGTARLRAAAGAARSLDGVRWSAELAAFGAAMGRAYDTSDDVFDWWSARIPRFR